MELAIICLHDICGIRVLNLVKIARDNWGIKKFKKIYIVGIKSLCKVIIKWAIDHEIECKSFVISTTKSPRIYSRCGQVIEIAAYSIIFINESDYILNRLVKTQHKRQYKTIVEFIVPLLTKREIIQQNIIC